MEPVKLSQTQLKRQQRARKIRPRPTNQSFRQRHKAQHHPNGKLHGWMRGDN